MMKRFAVLSLLTLGLVVQIKAQSFIEEITAKDQGEGTITINESPEIDKLINDTKLVISTPAQTQTPSTKTEAKKTTSTSKDRAGVQKNTGQMKTDEETGSVVSGKKVIKNGVKVTGYRVQAFSGGNTREDRTKAESIGHAIKSRYPSLPVYVHFYSPRWICRVGNFESYEEASTVLKNIKSMGYKEACIVKGKISVTH
ncbi:MAG: SPOR domain-containing protein [Prevotella sp.]|nr:SPOR domain-containing protein [Prevotella sp.]